jgi:Cu2+-exporting ATPase
MTAISPADAAHAVATACTHCGLPVPAGLLEPDAPRQFCCAGCRTAYTVIHEVGLDRYYEQAERRAHAVVPTGRSWEEFDHPAFHQLYVKSRPDGLLETSLYLDGVHCASCVWLVERVPLALPGVHEAELNIGRSLARVVWDGSRQPLSAIARFLDTLGYRPHPFRGMRADEARRAEDRAALARIGVAAALAANLMTVALAMYAGWFGGMERVIERYFRWISLALVTPAILWPGRVFFTGAWAALRTRRLHMDVPIALALGAGFVRGAMNTVTDTGPVYFDGLAVLIFLLLVGRFLQQRAQRAAIDSAELMYALSPSSARVVTDEGPRDVPTEALLPGMLVEVRATETVPADGVVTEGGSEVDVALLTGESVPVPVAPGSAVFAGSINVTAAFRMRVDQTGEQSRVGKMLHEVARGAQRRAPLVRAADRIAGWFVAASLSRRRWR